MSVSYWQDTQLGNINQIECDIVIIGAGLAGLSTAYWLKKKDPGLNLVVLDKGALGDGASGRNAGFITCGSTEHFSRMTSAYGQDKASAIWKFTEDNHKLLVEELGRERLEKKCEYRQLGSWTLASTEHEVATIKETVAALKSHGVAVEWHDFDQVREIFRPAGSQDPAIEGFLGGAKYYDDGEIHPGKLLRLLSISIPNVKILSNTEVFGFDYIGSDLLVLAKGVRLRCQVALLCVNAWAPQLHPFFHDKVIPTRGQILVTSPVAPFLEPAYCSFVLDYFRQLVDGRVLIGGFRNADVEKEVGYSDEINPIIHEKLELFLHQHFPLLRSTFIDYRWSGVMGFSKDGYPMVGSIPSDPQIYFNVGFTAHGLGFTFQMGKVLAELLIEAKDPGIFSANRFGA